jgi:uncharacterized damage-inducible protein DinB
MGMIEPMLQEMEQEAKATRRLLDRLPSDKLTWRPHTKSLSLGQLALHIAGIPGRIAEVVQQDTFEPRQQYAEPADRAEILALFEWSLQRASELLGPMDDAKLRSSWSAVVNGKTIMTIPKVAVLRTIAMNHLYHHRGELVVYLRLLNVPVPSVYGPTADENPFV